LESLLDLRQRCEQTQRLRRSEHSLNGYDA
jgi:hypothetical protein